MLSRKIFIIAIFTRVSLRFKICSASSYPQKIAQNWFPAILLPQLRPREDVLVCGLAVLHKLFDIVARLCVLVVSFLQLLLVLFYQHSYVLPSFSAWLYCSRSAMVCVIHQYLGTLADCLDNDDCLVAFPLLGTSTGSHISGQAQTFESYK